MLKETIKFTDFEGKPSQEIAYFNLSKVDAVRLSAKWGAEDEEGNKTLVEGLQQLAVSGDDVKMVDAIEDILLTAYGQRVPGGKVFERNAELRSKFENGPAYAELFIGFLNDPQSFTQFAGNLFADTSAEGGAKPVMTLIGGTAAKVD